MNYSHNFSICINAACQTADSMRHQFVTPEHFLLAIMQLPAWEKCSSHMSESNRICMECEVNGYINNLEQTPEDIWEEIKAEQEVPGMPVSEKMQELISRIEMQCQYS